MPIDSSVKGAFNALNQTFRNSDADTGMGGLGWWPSEGTYDCVVLDIEAGPTQIPIKDSGGLKVSGVSVQFFYRLLNDYDPEFKDEPRSFKGAPFLLPLQMSDVPEKNRQRFEIDLKRLKGHLQTLLNAPCDDLSLSLQKVSDRLETNGTPIVVQVKCQYTPPKQEGQQPFRKEFLVKHLSS